MVFVAGLVHQEHGLAAHVIHHGGHAAIIPQIPDCQTATGLRCGATGSALQADIFELSISGIPIQKPGFAVTGHMPMGAAPAIH